MAGQPCIILNSKSGRRKGAADDWLEPWRERGIRILRPDSPKLLTETVERAISEGCDPIIAAGGDGTIAAVADVVAGTDRRLGVVPLGTFNYFARSLDLPETPEEAMKAALDGEDIQITVGEVNGKVFLNNASLGAYAAILKAREGVYKDWGRSRLAAYWSVIVAMATMLNPLRMRVTVDGKEYQLRSPMAFVAVSEYQLREFGLDGAEKIRDGEMALLLAHDVGRLRLLWRALRVFFRSARRGADYQLITGRDILIETSRRHRLVAWDGEKKRMKGPFRFRLRENGLAVRVPAKNTRAA